MGNARLTLFAMLGSLCLGSAACAPAGEATTERDPGAPPAISSTSQMDSTCRTLTKFIGWPRNTNVIFGFADSIPEGAQRDEIRAALRLWQSANLGNHSNVTFTEAQSGQTVTLLFQNSLAPYPPRPSALADTAMTTPFVAVITFHVAVTDGLGVPWYNGGPGFYTKITLHEVGHTMGFADELLHCDASPRHSVMNDPDLPGDSDNCMAPSPTDCDTNTLQNELYPDDDFAMSANPASITVTQGSSTSIVIGTSVTHGNPGTVSLSASGAPSGVDLSFNTNPLAAGNATVLFINASASASVVTSRRISITGIEGLAQRQAAFSLTVQQAQSGGGGGGCPARIVPTRCIAGQDCCPSPIVIDVDGNGYDLTGPRDGVVFDIDASGHPEHVAWTSTGSDDAWLALDRNGNGIIDDATELFGDHTAQPPSDHKNGFLALAVFDDPANGGNGDGWISDADLVYSTLRLWVDRNHNGISEPEELHGLPELGIAAIGLEFRTSRRVDEHGNAFSYRARINRIRGAHDGRWAYDVFLMAGAAGGP